MINQPFNVLRHVRQWERAPRDPVTIGTAILGAVGAGGVAATTIAFGVTVAGVVGFLATTAITSWAMNALVPKPDLGGIGGSRGTLVNSVDPAAPHEFVYGLYRKGGIRTYTESTGTDNKYLHMIISMAGHEIDEFVSFYVNDEIVTVDGNGFVTSSPWNSKIRIKAHKADQTTVDPDLLAESNQIDTNFVGYGIAYMYIRLEYDQDVFANGIPLFTALVKGRKVYDPRTTSTAYSANAALCIRDYLTADFGLNDTNIDDVSFAASANVCDEDVDLSTSGTQPRYEANGVVSADMTPQEIVNRLITSCAGTLFWGQGNFQLKAGYYTSPVKTFTLDDLRSNISIDTRIASRDNFNRIVGTFADASADYVTSEYPAIESAAFTAEDNGVENTLDLQLPFTTSAAMAQRLAKLTLYRGREQITVSAEFGLSAFGVQAGDIVALTIDRYGWSAKPFEVTGWNFKYEDGDLRIAMTLRETSSAAFDWSAEERDIIYNNTTLPDARYVPTVGLSVVGGELRLVNQQVVGAILVDVTLNPLRADQLEFQYRQTGATDWIPAGTTTSVLSSNRFEVVGVTDGSFDFRARAINGIGVRGDWHTITGNYITLFTAPPQNVSNFSANVVGNTVHLTWTPTTDLDLSHYKIRFANATSGASYQNAVDLVAKVSRPANSITVPAQTGTYFIKAVDKLGNVSPAPSSIVVTTNTADLDGLNVVETLAQDPAFTGAKTNVVLLNDEIGNYIALDTATLFDSATGDFDDQAGLFDGGGDSVVMASTGYYEFDDYIDLGQKYVSRVSTSMDIRYLEYADTFDAASGLFDSRDGDFDGDPTQFDTTTARTQVSYTDDDPAGSPTWSDWRDFIVGDISARAIRFRAALETSSDSATPAIRELTATVDMPDRVEADDDITYTGSTVVTFPSAFKATPAIGIAAALADGDRYVISGKSRTGFTITTYTGGSVSSNAMTFDYVAKGYGKELS